jgi:hypothetical protein
MHHLPYVDQMGFDAKPIFNYGAKGPYPFITDSSNLPSSMDFNK